MTETAPTFSTPQDLQTFEFDRFKAQERNRAYLGAAAPSIEALRERLYEYYSMADLLRWLEKNPLYRKITLQFPDHLVSDSAIIAQALQAALDERVTAPNPSTPEAAPTECGEPSGACCAKTTTPTKCEEPSGACCTKIETPTKCGELARVWILADTSYSPCCIDEVAAEHVNSDLVIHFGDACLNNVDKLPSLYIFGKAFLDEEAFIKSFMETYPDQNQPIMLMADAPHTHHLPSLYAKLQSSYPRLAYATIKLPEGNTSVIIDRDECTSAVVGVHQVNRFLVGLEASVEMTQEELDAVLQQYALIHVSTPEAPRLLVLSTKFASLTLFEPTTNTLNQGPFPSLMKRYRYMHMARTAGTIGILVNTLSLKSTKAVLNRVAQWIKNSGKKHYVFVVGKPNVAKLANFESIDLWCVLGCGQAGIIVDQVGDFYKPVITPYELQMALTDEVSWSGKWITDFEEVLSTGFEVEAKAAPGVDDEDEAPEFNAVTGAYVSTSRPLRRLQHMLVAETAESGGADQSEDGVLVKKFASTVAIRGTVSTSAAVLQKREWTGLGSDFERMDAEGKEAGAPLEEGRGGVARGYDK